MRLGKILSIITIVLLIGNTKTVHANRYYVDIYGHWAQDTILWGTNEVSLFTGYEDGTFKPDEYMTRSEYITLLVRAANIQNVFPKNDEVTTYVVQPLPDETIGYNLNEEENNELPYSDITTDFWAYDNIKLLYNYINGQDKGFIFEDIFSENRFQPNKRITREEATLLTYFFIYPPIEEKFHEFKDIDLNYKYDKQIKALVDNEIIQGYPDNTFRLKDGIKRGESATLIKSIYNEMNFFSSIYLSSIELVSTTRDYKYNLFGDYVDRELSNEDLIYKKAISTLEYKAIIGTIPYEERHLYDSHPVETLKDLKSANYWNTIGINYYLLRHNNYDDFTRKELYKEILEAYVDRNDISDLESILIFENISNDEINEELLLTAVDKWYNNTKDIKSKLNSIFVKTRVYLSNEKTDTALQYYNNAIRSTKIENIDIDIESTIHFNKAYLYLILNKYNEAENVLRDGWSSIKMSSSYSINKNIYDMNYKGAIKEVLLKKEIH